MLRCSHVCGGRRLAIGVGGEARGTTTAFTTSGGEEEGEGEEEEEGEGR